MTHEIRFSRTARRDLERVPPRILTAIIEFVYGDLADSPHRVGKPLLRELTGTFNAGRGPYRVLFEIDDEHRRVDVLRIAHRSDVYRRR